MSASPLLIEEYFECEDRRFLHEVLHCEVEAWLGTFARRWFRDSRPFAREMLLAYIDDGCDRPHHRVVVKHLFKDAEDARDDVLMVRFAVAFDHLIRRRWVESRYYNYRARAFTVWRHLARDPNIPTSATAAERSGRFSRATRLYLARRAFRYLRKLGHEAPLRYRAAALDALARYRDEGFSHPSNVLDAWTLYHICFWASPIASREPRGIYLKGDLDELQPAPIYPEVWDAATFELLDLLTTAEASVVRQWATRMVQARATALGDAFPLARVLRLLMSHHAEAQRLGAELLALRSDLGRLSVEDWLKTLGVHDALAAATVCQLVEAHVHPATLSLAECVALACARLQPVAELGLGWARDRAGRDAADLDTLAGLVAAPIADLRERAVAWLIQRLAEAPSVPFERVRDLIDAPFADVRAHGLRLMFGDDRFRLHTGLWSALAESPHGDVRDALIDALQTIEGELAPGQVQHVWASALLAVHRGSARKRTALRQIADRIVSHPDETDALIPLFRVALRSVRANERRGALAQVARAALLRPDLRERLHAALPELKLGQEVV